MNMAKDRQITTSNRNVVGYRIAKVEGIAIGMLERLDEGKDITPIGAANLLAAAQAVADAVENLETEL